MCELGVKGKNLTEGLSRNLLAEHRRKGHARRLKYGQVWNWVSWGIRGKIWRGLKGTGETSGKKNRTTENRKECIYYIKMKHLSLLKVTKDS